MCQDLDMAWAAGLFEGNGCISMTSSQPYMVRLWVVNEDRSVVVRFRQIVGCGHINQQQNSKSWRWYTGRSKEVLELLTLFQPRMGDMHRMKAQDAVDRLQGRH